MNNDEYRYMKRAVVSLESIAESLSLLVDLVLRENNGEQWHPTSHEYEERHDEDG